MSKGNFFCEDCGGLFDYESQAQYAATRWVCKACVYWSARWAENAARTIGELATRPSNLAGITTTTRQEEKEACLQEQFARDAIRQSPEETVVRKKALRGY
jgi:nitrogenase subunit NifH